MDNVRKKSKICEIITTPEKARNYITHEEYDSQLNQSYSDDYKRKILIECSWQLLRKITDLEYLNKKQETNIEENILISRESFNSIPAAFTEIETMLKSVMEALTPFAHCITKAGQMADIIHLSREDFQNAAKAIEAVKLVKDQTRKIQQLPKNQKL